MTKTDHMKLLDSAVQLLWRIDNLHRKDEIPKEKQLEMASRKERLERFKKFVQLRKQFK